ncbi:haloacid dehalogenase-like hydrolase [Thalassobius sp. S69A]|uniref:haloacid dehalogenase-like hydrolase n=1 Tax=unclassified Thalassovita TaxID=2619711 RepID=UPI000C44178F|nr:hypothetical protein [Paracoccaceae bacterium]
MSARLLAVDVCGTLYPDNTTAGFVRFHAARTGHRPWRFRLLEALRQSPFRMAVIALGKALRRDLFRQGYIRCLKGQPRPALSQSAQAYAAHLEATRQIAQTHARLARMQAQGWQVMLASNSLDVVISAIAQAKSLPWVASALAFDGDICTGRLTTDLKGHKLRAVQAVCSFDALAVMTDNKSDTDLIRAADLAILVAPRHPKPWMEAYPDAETLYY